MPIPVPLRSEHPRAPLHPAPVPRPLAAAPLAPLAHVLVPVADAREGLLAAGGLAAEAAGLWDGVVGAEGVGGLWVGAGGVSRLRRT